MKYRQALFLAAGLLLLTDSAPVRAQDGDAYRIFANSIRVDRASHWDNWVLQNDMVSNLNVPIVESGMFEINTKGLKPVFWRRSINAAPDAVNFTYKDRVRAEGVSVDGGASSLSNDRIAVRVIDDNLSTYWEPEAPATYATRLRNPEDFSIQGLPNWEMLIDLGRLVFADSITVVFPAGKLTDDGEFLGNPPKAFALFASMGERFPFPLGNNFKFTLLGQVAISEAAGKAAEHTPEHRAEQAAASIEQRDEGDELKVSQPFPFDEDGNYTAITFRLDPLDRADFDQDGLPDIRGGFLQYIKLTLTDTDLWRDQFLGADEEGQVLYEALPAERRGALVYQRETAGGFLVELEDESDRSAADKWAELPQSKRGPILYYVREVPRVSEILVWTKGDNFALAPEKRAGGSFEHGGLGTPREATDGNYDTEWVANTWSPIYVKGTAWWDLGAVFWVDNMFVVMKRINQSHQGAFRGHEFLISDGTLLQPIQMDDRQDFPLLEDGLKWDNIISEDQLNNPFQVRIWNERFPLRQVRFLQARDIDITGQQSGRYGSLGTMSEIQFYGEGYPVSVWAYSPPIRLTDSRGNFIRKALPKIAWGGEAIIRQTDPVTGRPVEIAESLELHPDVQLSIQTRTSDQTDSAFTYFEVVDAGGQIERQEITKEAHDEINYRWTVWNTWEGLALPHKSNNDDDGDGSIDEDPINFADDDGDGLVDEDGKKLGKGKRPRSTAEKDGELALVGWSEWSDSYQPTNGVNEAIVTSPNPRKFIQIRVNIESDNPFSTGRINSLRIDLAPPLALEAAGELALLSGQGMTRQIVDLEVDPEDYLAPKDVNPLESHLFSYFIRASEPDPGDATVGTGFREVLIVASQTTSLRGVRFGQVTVTSVPSLLDSSVELTQAVRTNFDTYFRETADGTFRNGAGEELEVIPTASDSLWIRLPSAINSGLRFNSHGLVEIQFESQIFREGIEVTSFIRSEASVFQRVDTEALDATELVDSGTARIALASTAGGLINDLLVDRVITPNGDNTNETLDIQFTLLKVNEDRPIEVTFHDLSGRIVGRARPAGADGLPVSAVMASKYEDGEGVIVEAPSVGQAGVLRFTWDARNSDDKLVPPGIYVARIQVQADDGDTDIVRTVNVVY